MSDAPQKRPWFQFYLSTALILSLAAGALMLLNFRERSVRQVSPIEGDSELNVVDAGWPLWAHRKVGRYPLPVTDWEGWNMDHLALNCLAGVVLLAMIAVVLQPTMRQRLAGLFRKRFHPVSRACLVAVMAGLLWANSAGHGSCSYIAGYDTSGDTFDPIVRCSARYGWPMAYTEYGVHYVSPVPWNLNLPVETPQLRALPLLLDLAVAVGLAALALYACEYLIRRKERRP
ncbi:MAG: hypothetical protein NTW87_10655 [Planctomycetota bacterium]|nr:hypothetical protein [Planctomycetota bacterium]